MIDRTKRAAGFTLVEILVGVAILAILSAALTPMVIKYVNDARRSRALSDSQALGQAVLAFNLDVGRWPVNGDGNPNDAGEISRLVGLPAAQISAANIPDGNGPRGANNWDSAGRASAIEDQLIRNRAGRVNPLYAASQTAPEPPGWNGPYIDSVPADPWGNPYVCNVRFLRLASVSGVTPAEAANHAVFCLSAGPDGQFNTSFDDRTKLAGPGGDDIGWPIQGLQNL